MIPLTVLTRAALALPAVFALAGAAFFQTPTSAQAAPAGQTTPVGLGLNAAQQGKANARQAQFQKDVEALRADPQMTMAQKQAKYTTLLQAMDRDMLAILTPAQRTQVTKQRAINAQFKADVLALQSDRKLTDAQKKAKYLQLTQNARNASLAIMTPAQRTDALKRSAAAEKLQQEQAPKIAEAKRLSQHAIGLSTGTAIQSVIADKTLSAQAQTAKITLLRQDALQRDMALLTPAQRTLYSRIQTLITLPAH